MDHFAQRIKQLRQESGLSQEALGEVIGVSKYSVYTYEKGKNYPEVKSFFALAEYFKVSLDYLAGWSDHRGINR